MKKILMITSAFLLISISSCDVVKKMASVLAPSEFEMITGLKEALTQGLFKSFDAFADPQGNPLVRFVFPGEAEMPQVTNTMAPIYPAANIAQPDVCQAALVHRARATGPYHRSHALRRRSISQRPILVSRTSLPGDAVVAMSNRCRASRFDDAPRSSACRSTAGRQVEVSTVGKANNTNAASAGCTDISKPIVTTSRSTQPQVVNNDIYM